MSGSGSEPPCAGMSSRMTRSLSSQTNPFAQDMKRGCVVGQHELRSYCHGSDGWGRSCSSQPLRIERKSRGYIETLAGRFSERVESVVSRLIECRLDSSQSKVFEY